jgi:lambda family phage tail tape measure protein
MAIISRLAVLLGLDAGEFNAGLGKAKAGITEFTQSTLGAKLGVAALAIGFTEFARSAVQYADQISDVAKANDMAVGTVLALNEAMVENGGNAEAASRMMSGFSKQVEAAASGTDKTRETFQKLGVSLQDLKKLSVDDLLIKTLKGLNDIQDSATRNAKAMELFGKSIKGVDIKGFYNDLIEGKDKNKEAEQSFMETKAVMDALSATMMQAKVDFIETFAPAIESLTKIFLDLAYAIHSAFRAGKDLLTLNFKDLKTYDFAGVQFEKDLNARFEKARLASLASQNTPFAGREVNALGDEGKRQTEELQKQILTFNQEAKAVGEVKSEYEKLTAQFNLGGKYAKASNKDKYDAAVAAYKLDEMHQQEQTKNEIKIYDTEIERLQLQADMAGFSDIEQKKLMAQLDLHIKLNDEVKKQIISQEQADQIYSSFTKMQKQQDMTLQAQQTFSAGWSKAYNDWVEKSKDAAALGKQAFEGMVQTMSSALDEFVKTGKLNFKSLISDMIQQLIRLQLQAQLSGILGMIGKSFGFGGGGGGTSVPIDFSLFTPKADGGSFGGNQPLLVGENGPELMIPNQSGVVVPNNSLSSMMGSQPQIVYNGPYIANMSAIDTQSAVQFLAKNKQAVWAANQSATRSLPQSR